MFVLTLHRKYVTYLNIHKKNKPKTKQANLFDGTEKNSNYSHCLQFFFINDVDLNRTYQVGDLSEWDNAWVKTLQVFHNIQIDIYF